MATLNERLNKVIADHGTLIEQKNGLLEQIQQVEVQLLVLQGRAVQLQELLAENDEASKLNATDEAPTAE